MTANRTVIGAEESGEYTSEPKLGRAVRDGLVDAWQAAFRSDPPRPVAVQDIDAQIMRFRDR